LFGGVYASATLGISCGSSPTAHQSTLRVLRRHLIALSERTPLLAGIGQRAFVDIDSLLRPVYGHAKQGASFGHTRIAGKSVLRRGLSPLAVTIATPTAAPVIAAVRLRAGRAGSAGAPRACSPRRSTPAKAAGAVASNILVRGDCAYGNSKVIAAVLKTGARFSFVPVKNAPVNAAIASIPDERYTPVHYPARWSIPTPAS